MSKVCRFLSLPLGWLSGFILLPTSYLVQSIATMFAKLIDVNMVLQCLLLCCTNNIDYQAATLLIFSGAKNYGLWIYYLGQGFWLLHNRRLCITYFFLP